MGSPAPVPKEIDRSAQQGELQKVVDALCPTRTEGGQASAFSLLHAAAGYDQLKMVRELLK